MAGNKTFQEPNDQYTGKRQGHAYTSEQTQAGAAPKRGAAARRASSHPSRQAAGPFNFDSLTSHYKIGIIKQGISKTQLEAIKSETDFDYNTLSNLLSVSRTTLIKKKGDEKFDQPTSERIMLLAELISYGREVFEHKERFNAWLKKPAIALGGKAPVELLDTLYGIEEVKKELGRIEYGVY
jgi:putative toxin-antitoxin system antitoxin component (TIGR02293 family)